MIVIDIETTGTNPFKHSILSLGAVDFRAPEVQFYEECRIWDGAKVEEEALAANGTKVEDLTDKSKQTEESLVKNFLTWLEERDDMRIAGQSVFFDRSFIESASARAGIPSKLSYRVIDLHSITFAHMIRRGIEPPVLNRKTNLNSDKIMEYVGIPAEPRPHIGLNGALWEAEAFSRLLYDKPLLTQFEKYPVPWISAQ
ncbi:MAG: hypothetical protein A2741_01340 [Candidatus Zambryskibacteria bacterium RIFCSPHIGHO2_01_FULL_43_27]|uniref:Exonuclease domain-containing protein n=1 Tax=Candidatus Zambryskibacteria bacterium RIFCSPLOWO2_01_FULL_43_17 TaxID=1802760 RepID=A0A1G2U2D8_9BACT|nr:MAG: hypothetical protein A2741_01340 [Candidatus Zambryskibacteria bacterium RIFCSPHIGHO2_01_FULL_43_27]OHA99922.1 MAG: hypothetical protein A3E93_00250 [Candidatus Zambryskibacteria bacterium RIFCSPHIGHO2_12_FULL_43_12b]OHB03686.1 MAG: hypothetical protein A2920_03195 [Candidatus Zambryskibacteria bacterium RIFCSPLOWO2_01_FULL_43_17]